MATAVCGGIPCSAQSDAARGDDATPAHCEHSVAGAITVIPKSRKNRFNAFAPQRDTPDGAGVETAQPSISVSRGDRRTMKSLSDWNLISPTLSRGFSNLETVTLA